MKNENKGISIIETVIYLTIFSFMSFIVINSFFVIFNSLATIKTNHNFSNSGASAINRISQEVRQAKKINILSNTNSLYLEGVDLNGTPYTIKFLKEGNQLNVYKNDNLSGNLLNNNILLESIIFNYIYNGKSEAVKTEIILKNTTKKTTRLEKFYSTIVLREAY